MKRSELFFTFILLPLDIVMAVLSFVGAFYLREHVEIANTTFAAKISDYISLSVYFVPALIVIYALNGLYYSRSSKGLAAELYRIFESNSAALALLVLVLFFSKTSEFSRLILLFTWVLSIVLVYTARLLVRIIQKALLKYGIGRRNLAVIGSTEVARFIASEINKNPWEGYKFVGALDDKPTQEIRILGKVADFEHMLEKNGIDEVVVIDSEISRANLASLVDYCGDKHIIIKIVPNIAAELSIKLSSGSIGSMPILEIKTTALDGWGRIVKRIADIVFAIVSILILSPILLLLVVLEKVTSRGPVIYSHDRVGRDGKTFRLHKFRSMYQDAEKGGRFWTEANDDRITPLGKILRKTNLDELPQLWNILVGNMSFVGPRPEQPRWVEKFSQEVPDYIKRHRVKSGLTGWAQVNGLKGDTSIKERVRYDMYYIENWSIWFDIKIIAKTFWLIIYEIFKGKYEYRAGS